MMVLVIYSFTDAQFFEAPFGLDEVIAGALVVSCYVLTRNNLLAIAAGTGVYMYFQQSGILLTLLN